MTSWILLCALAGLLGADDGPGKPAAKRPEAAKAAWATLEEAIAAARKDYRPILILHAPQAEGEAANPIFSTDARAALADPEVAKLLRGFSCVDLDRAALEKEYPAAARSGAAPAPPAGADAKKPARPVRGRGKAAGVDAKQDPVPDPPPGEPGTPGAAQTAGRKLGIAAGTPTLLVLDFRETVVRRISEKMPRREAFRKDLRALAAECARQAAVARKVEAVLEEAEYAYKLGETRKAVLAVVPLDDPGAQRTMDRVLAQRVGGILERYKKDAATAMAAGDSLERAKKYADAVTAYQDAARKYPFPDVVKESNKKQGAAMRKARGLF
jgi:hypothetical protein